MQLVYEIVRLAHIVFASVGLLALLPPLISRKGGRLHRRAGMAFVAAMTAAAVTGNALAGAWIAAPQVFRASIDSASARHAGVFLLLVGSMTLSAMWQGMRALARRRSPRTTAYQRVVDLGLPAVVILGALFVLSLGIASGTVLFVLFAPIGLLVGGTNFKLAWAPARERMGWWYGHMSGMLTATISAVTAFAVVGAGPRLATLLPAGMRWVVWVGPPMVLAPLFQLWIRYYRRKFGDADTQSPAVLAAARIP